MDANAWKAKGNEAFTAKQFDAAIEAFSEAIKLDPSNHVLWSNRSGAYAAKGDWDNALSDAQATVKANASWPKGYIRVGAALHGQGKFAEAIEAYEQGLKIEPGNATILESIDAVKVDQTRSANASNPFAKMFGPDTLGKIAANPRLAPMLAKPGYADKIRLLMSNPGLVQGMMQDQDIMMTFVELAGLGDKFAAKPAEPSAAKPKADSDDDVPPPAPKPVPKPAAKSAAATCGSGNAESLKLKEEGNALYKKREFDAALEKYAAAFEMDPTNTTLLLNRTAVLFEQGKFDEAMVEVDKATEHATEHKADYTIKAKIMTRRASILQKQKKFDEAVALFKSALLEHRNAETLTKLEQCEAEKKKADTEAYFSVELSLQAKEEGNAAFKKDDYPTAVKHYDEAIKRNPGDHTLYSNRAAALLKLRAYEDAIRDCDKCLEINPNFVRAHARKGHGYFWTKQYNRALQAYDAGLKIEPDHAECLDGRDRTRAKIQENLQGEGDDEAAARAMQDPEIQGILGDTYMQMVLQELQRDPNRLQEYMRDTRIASNLNKLVTAGVLRMGSAPAKRK
jgi:stress-induced-phosphoprotein 1